VPNGVTIETTTQVEKESSEEHDKPKITHKYNSRPRVK
jgi:hypothetical protein